MTHPRGIGFDRARRDPPAGGAARRLRAAVPTIMTVVGMVVFGGLWIAKVWKLGASVPGMLVLTGGLVYLAWVIGEARVSVRELTTTGPTYDRGTLEWAAVAKQVLLLAALLPATRPGWVTGPAGILMIVLGGGLRIAAVRRMGRRYTHRIRVPADGLVTAGPYRLVRHPAYLGTLVGHAGIAVLLLSPWSIAALVLAWLPVVAARTWLEDRLLRDRAAGYQAYCSRTRWRLVPGVW